MKQYNFHKHEKIPVEVHNLPMNIVSEFENGMKEDKRIKDEFEIKIIKEYKKDKKKLPSSKECEEKYLNEIKNKYKRLRDEYYIGVKYKYFGKLHCFCEYYVIQLQVTFEFHEGVCKMIKLFRWNGKDICWERSVMNNVVTFKKYKKEKEELNALREKEEEKKE